MTHAGISAVANQKDVGRKAFKALGSIALVTIGDIALSARKWLKRVIFVIASRAVGKAGPVGHVEGDEAKQIEPIFALSASVHCTNSAPCVSAGGTISLRYIIDDSCAGVVPITAVRNASVVDCQEVASRAMRA